ncbi:MAG: DUF3134 family protein [Oculatellaceae cyanobacterium bins.114]|nr:DUF3134 family protein [Oculatellaceae cyanobacterium bins.114]
MATYYNPALSEEPRNQPMRLVPPIPKETLLNWLESSGRFRSSENDEFQEHKISEDLDDILEPELYVLETEDDDEE